MSTQQKRKRNNNKFRLDIITERFLFEIIKIVSSDTFITKRMLSNINKLLEDIDLDYYYKKNSELALLIKTIKIVTNIKKYNHIFDTDGAIVEIENNLKTETDEKFIMNSIIPTIEASSRKDFKHKAEEMGKAISNYIQYGFVLNLKSELVSLVSDIEFAYGAELQEKMIAFREVVRQINEYFKGTDLNNTMGGIMHMVEDPYIDSLIDTYNNSKDPGTVLRTGIQALNGALSARGGFVPGLYFIYACTNHGKSIFLKQCAIMIQKFNEHIFGTKKFKGTNKIPTFLEISLENSKYEDEERDVKMRTFQDMDAFPNSEAMVNRWKASFYGNPEGKDKGNTINIAVYRPDEIDGIQQKFRASDLIDLIDTLNEEGYEVIGVSIDYFQLIAPEKSDEHLDLRTQYGMTAALLLKIMRRYNIPIIVPHQLNREAERLINEMKREGKMNIVTSLGAQYIGESYWIEKAATYSCFIMLENHPITNKSYFGYKRGKTRGRTNPEWPYFYHEIHNGLCFEYDIDKPKPLSLKSLTIEGDLGSAEAYASATNSSGIRGRLVPNAETEVPKSNEPIVIESEEKDTAIYEELLNSLSAEAKLEEEASKYKYMWVSKRDKQKPEIEIVDGYVWIHRSKRRA